MLWTRLSIVKIKLYQHCFWTLFQCCFNVKHRRCINIVQRWKSDVGFCFIFNVESTLFQRWSTTLKQRWSDAEMLAGLWLHSSLRAYSEPNWMCTLEIFVKLLMVFAKSFLFDIASLSLFMFVKFQEVPSISISSCISCITIFLSFQ